MASHWHVVYYINWVVQSGLKINPEPPKSFSSKSKMIYYWYAAYVIKKSLTNGPSSI